MTTKLMTEQERRRRLATRHALTSDSRVDAVANAARSVVCLHATDPSTIYLSAWARIDGVAHTDIDASLYEHRDVVKHMAMRRTLHVLPTENLAMAQAAASNRVAEAERRRFIKDIESNGLTKNGQRWLAKTQKLVLEYLAENEATFTEMKRHLPLLDKKISIAPDTKWGGDMPIGPRVLTIMSASGLIVRSTNDGAWYVSRNRWTTTENWLGRPIEVISEAEGTAELTREWLRQFGPGTIDDIQWWMKSTVKAVKRALADLNAVEVQLDDGLVGWVLPDDIDDTDNDDEWVALLPSLDPTAMGWKQRNFYLGDYKTQIFDSVGNAGPTVWHNGRIVGGWAQSGDGTVVAHLLEDIGTEAIDAIEQRAAELTAWCGIKRVMPRFPSPLSKEIAALQNG